MNKDTNNSTRQRNRISAVLSSKLPVLSKLLATLLFLIIVTAVQATTYYSAPSGTNISARDKTKWWTNTNETGTHPGNFTTAGDIFIIQPGVSMIIGANNWTVTGTLNVQGTFAGPTNNAKTLSLGALIIASGGSASAGIGKLTVIGGTTIAGTLTMATAKDINFGGLVTISSGGTYTETVAAKVFYKGGLTNNGTFTASTGVHEFKTNAQAINGTVSIPNVKINGVTLTNNGTFTISAALTEGGTSGLTQGTNATLNYYGATLTVDALTATATGNTVNYYRAGAQTVKATTYYNLTLSGSGAKTTTGVTVNGTLSMEGTATASAAPTYGTNATLRYNTATSRTAGVEWITPFAATGGVIIANTGTITMNAAKVFNCGIPLTINSGATLATNNFALTFGGNFTRNGTFNAGSSNITINCTNNQTISGFTTTGTVTMSKTGGTATFTGNVSGGALTINGSGGTLDLGIGFTHTFSGIALTAGTLKGGSSTLNDTGNWTGTGSLFTAENSTVVFGASAAQAISATSTTFNNVTFSGSGNKTVSNAITVNGTMSVSGSAVVLLANGTTSTVYALYLGGVPQVGGSWGGTTSAATNKSATWFGTTTTGILNASLLNRLVITGSGTQTAGTSQNLTITVKSPAGAIITSYTGDHNLTFSGANLSPNSSAPTVKDKNGTATSFGSATTITFTNGVATVSGSNNGVMTLYKEETAVISVTDGTISSQGVDKLTVLVSATYGLVFTTQPGGGLVDEVWATQPIVTVQDAYGNLSTGTAMDITLAIQNNAGPGGVLSGTDTVAVNTTTAQAVFTDLSINISGSGYTLQASTSGLSNATSNAFDISNPNPTITSISPTEVCAGGTNFTIIVTGTNFNTSSVVKINGSPRTTTFISATEVQATILAADIASGGTPAITVFNPAPGGGTTSSATLTVSQVAFSPAITQPSCYAFGKIVLGFISGGTAPYTYDWADLSGTNDVKDRVGLSAGTYSVTVTDAKGCTVSSGNLVLNAPSGCTGISVCQSDAASVISADPDPANTSYTWSIESAANPGTFYTSAITSGQGTPSITVNWTGVPVGHYMVCVTGNNICDTSLQTCIDVYVEKPDISAYADTVCTGGNLYLYAYGGATYSWTGPNSFASNSQFPVIYNATPSATGIYSVTVTAANGCVASTTVSVTVNAPPSISGTVTNSTCGNSDGTINITVTGGSGFKYSWSNGEITEDLSNLPSGNYTVTVTNSTGCSSVKTFVIKDTDGPSATATSVNVSCNGGSNGSINLTPSGGTSPYSFDWSNDSTSEDLSGLTAGTYSVVVTDDNGCIAGVIVTITQPSAPIQVNGVVTNVSCFGNTTGSIALTVTGGTGSYNYDWADVAGTSNSKDRSSLAAGTYTITITDANSCTFIHSYTVTQPAAALSASNTKTDVSCYNGSNGSVNLSVSGGTSPYTYLWAKAGGGFSATTQDLTNLSAGTYNVTVTDNKGCTTTSSATILQPAAALTASAVATAVSCNGGSNGSVNLTASNGTPSYSYLWSNQATTEDLSNVVTGNYLVTVTDAHGCTTSTSAIVTEPTLLSASISGSTPVSCHGGANGTATASQTGGTPPYHYSWNTSPVQTTATATGLAANIIYSVIITDSLGCVANTNATVTQPNVIDISGFVTHVSCYNGTNGAINITVGGGSEPYTYLWQDGPSTKNRSSLSAGTYYVTVTDSNNCTATASYTVNQPQDITASAVASGITCHGNINGSVNLTVNGGTQPYSYVWNNGAGTEDISGLGQGTYTVTITDLNGCTETASAVVTQPNEILLSANKKNNCYNQSNGEIDLTITGGTGPFSYSWTGPNGFLSANQDISGLIAGTYHVTVTDLNNCTATGTYELVNITATLISIPVSCNYMISGLYDGALYAITENGTAPLTFSWTKNGIPLPDTSPVLSGISWGIYQVTVSDAQSCTYSVSDTLYQPVCNPPVAVDDTFTSCNNAVVTGSVALNDSDPDNSINQLEFINMNNPSANQGVLQWNNAYNGSFTFTPTAGYDGIVQINYIVEDSLGLSDIGLLSIYISSMSAEVTAANTHHAHCGNNEGSAMVACSGGFKDYSYLWNDPAATTSNIANNLAAGTYIVTVTDTLGCSVTASVNIKNICLTIDKSLYSVNNDTSLTTFTMIGDTITYHVVVTNTGSDTLFNTLVTDPLTGMNETINTLVPAGSHTYTATHFITAGDIAANFVSNTATADYSYHGNNYSVSDSAIVWSAFADLSIIKEVLTSPVVAGGELAYMIVITNAGPTYAYNAVIWDNITAFPPPVYYSLDG
ncbi:MAG TPA: cadherin-like domain-containing protein, partial [Bacteroidales bacterium]|nr:cadherin-like domain-containing protein [Bacteroidales bacterium]